MIYTYDPMFNSNKLKIETLNLGDIIIFDAKAMWIIVSIEKKTKEQVKLSVIEMKDGAWKTASATFFKEISFLREVN